MPIPTDPIALKMYCFGAAFFFAGMFALVFFLWRYDKKYKGRARAKRTHTPVAISNPPRDLDLHVLRYRTRDGMTHVFPKIPRSRMDEDTNILPRTSDNRETHFIDIPDWEFLNGPRQTHG